MWQMADAAVASAFITAAGFVELDSRADQGCAAISPCKGSH